MMDCSTPIIERQRAKYETDTRSWVGSVRSARRLDDAMQFARREPQPGYLLRGLGSMTGQYRARALREIDRILSERLASIGDADKPKCLQLAQGMANFPGVMRWLRDERSKAVAARKAGRA